MRPSGIDARPPRFRRPALLTALAAMALLVPATLVPAAVAAPPPNDARTKPTVLSPPSTVRGTTVESTLDPDELPFVAGMPIGGSVWYQLSAPAPRTAVLRLSAAGELDAAIEVFRRARSQLVSEQSAPTDEDGRAQLVFELRPRATYLIRVAHRGNSVPGEFELQVFLPEPPPLGPGAPLRAGAASGSVDPLGKTADAYSAVLREGVTYRIRVINRSSRRLRFGMYGPGTRDFSGSSPVGASRSYQLFTPDEGEGGRYSFLVQATGLGSRQAYRLLVGRAGPDDMWPGRRLGNFDRVRGTLSDSGLDVVDVYRFDLASRSAVTVALRSADAGDLSLRLLRARGGRVGSAVGGDLKRTLTPGRYVIVVRARRGGTGAYTIRREARTITRLRLGVRGSRAVAPGSSVALGVQLLPDVSGLVWITLERFDPPTGWHFVRTLSVRVADGSAVVAYRPPVIGRWRARAEFAGTRSAEPSSTPGDVEWSVLAPLEP